MRVENYVELVKSKSFFCYRSAFAVVAPVKPIYKNAHGTFNIFSSIKDN